MSRKTDTADEQIGKKIRERRHLLGFTCPQFAEFLGISFQQLYKYENGKNRVSSSQLAKIARLLNVDVNYFFSDSLDVLGLNKTDPCNAARIASEPETTKLVKNYISIPDPRVRDAVTELVTSVTKYLTRKSV